MDNLESIDKYLVSEIDGLESTPSDQVWNSIESKMQAGKAARKIRSRNWKIAGASALAVATVSIITYATLSQPKPETNTIAANKPAITTPIQNTTISAGEKQEVITSVPKENTEPTFKQNSSLNENIPSEKQIRKRSENKKDIIDVAPAIKQDVPVNTSAVTTAASENKKDNSDKSIIMLPYFAPGHTGTNNTQTDKATPPSPSVSTKIDQGDNTIKSDPKENTIYMPNAFTPNGDGLNDVFIPQTAETPGEYKLSIFDRSGNLVFFSDDIQKGWDGRINKNGMEEVREDVYIWRIEMKTAKGEKRHLMGSLTLLK